MSKQDDLNSSCSLQNGRRRNKVHDVFSHLRVTLRIQVGKRLISGWVRHLYEWMAGWIGETYIISPCPHSYNKKKMCLFKSRGRETVRHTEPQVSMKVSI